MIRTPTTIAMRIQPRPSLPVWTSFLASSSSVKGQKPEPVSPVPPEVESTPARAAVAVAPAGLCPSSAAPAASAARAARAAAGAPPPGPADSGGPGGRPRRGGPPPLGAGEQRALGDVLEGRRGSGRLGRCLERGHRVRALPGLLVDLGVLGVRFLRRGRRGLHGGLRRLVRRG